MTARETEVRTKVEALRARYVERWNKKRREPPVFVVGGQCWYVSAQCKDSQLHGRWAGPYDIRGRIGEHSYVLWTGLREFTAHVCVKTSYEQGFGSRPVPLSFEKLSKKVRLEVSEEDYEVDTILGHRVTRGVFEFKTKWKGVPESEADWQPVGSFVDKYCVELVKYARDKNLLDISVLRHLSADVGVYDGLGSNV